MRAVRVTIAALFCSCVAWAVADERKDSEEKEHKTARAVLAKAKVDLLKAIGTAQAKISKGQPIYATTEEEDGNLLFEVFSSSAKM